MSRLQFNNEVNPGKLGDLSSYYGNLNGSEATLAKLASNDYSHLLNSSMSDTKYLGVVSAVLPVVINNHTTPEVVEDLMRDPSFRRLVESRTQAYVPGSDELRRSIRNKLLGRGNTTGRAEVPDSKAYDDLSGKRNALSNEVHDDYDVDSYADNLANLATIVAPNLPKAFDPNTEINGNTDGKTLDNLRNSVSDYVANMGRAKYSGGSKMKYYNRDMSYKVKLPTNGYETFKQMSLDGLHLWDIKISPYGASWLPPIPTDTGWLPCTDYEWNRGNISNMAVDISEASAINIPKMYDMANTFTMTVLDDQYGKWYDYWQKVEYITVDPNGVAVAPYKKVTFLIELYVMNPGMTIRWHSKLLCVLANFSDTTSVNDTPQASSHQLQFNVVGEL